MDTNQLPNHKSHQQVSTQQDSQTSKQTGNLEIASSSWLQKHQSDTVISKDIQTTKTQDKHATQAVPYEYYFSSSQNLSNPQKSNTSIQEPKQKDNSHNKLLQTAVEQSQITEKLLGSQAIQQQQGQQGLREKRNSNLNNIFTGSQQSLKQSPSITAALVASKAMTFNRAQSPPANSNLTSKTHNLSFNEHVFHPKLPTSATLPKNKLLSLTPQSLSKFNKTIQQSKFISTNHNHHHHVQTNPNNSKNTNTLETVNEKSKEITQIGVNRPYRRHSQVPDNFQIKLDSCTKDFLTSKGFNVNKDANNFSAAIKQSEDIPAEIVNTPTALPHKTQQHPMNLSPIRFSSPQNLLNINSENSQATTKMTVSLDSKPTSPMQADPSIPTSNLAFSNLLAKNAQKSTATPAQALPSTQYIEELLGKRKNSKTPIITEATVSETKQFAEAHSFLAPQSISSQVHMNDTKAKANDQRTNRNQGQSGQTSPNNRNNIANTSVTSANTAANNHGNMQSSSSAASPSYQPSQGSSKFSSVSPLHLRSPFMQPQTHNDNQAHHISLDPPAHSAAINQLNLNLVPLKPISGTPPAGSFGELDGGDSRTQASNHTSGSHKNNSNQNQQLESFHASIQNLSRKNSDNLGTNNQIDNINNTAGLFENDKNQQKNSLQDYQGISSLGDFINLPLHPESNKYNTITFPLNANQYNNSNNNIGTEIQQYSPVNKNNRDLAQNQDNNPFGVASATDSDKEQTSSLFVSPKFFGEQTSSEQKYNKISQSDLAVSVKSFEEVNKMLTFDEKQLENHTPKASQLQQNHSNTEQMHQFLIHSSSLQNTKLPPMMNPSEIDKTNMHFSVSPSGYNTMVNQKNTQSLKSISPSNLINQQQQKQIAIKPISIQNNITLLKNNLANSILNNLGTPQHNLANLKAISPRMFKKDISPKVAQTEGIPVSPMAQQVIQLDTKKSITPKNQVIQQDQVKSVISPLNSNTPLGNTQTKGMQTFSSITEKEQIKVKIEEIIVQSPSVAVTKKAETTEQQPIIYKTPTVYVVNSPNIANISAKTAGNVDEDQKDEVLPVPKQILPYGKIISSSPNAVINNKVVDLSKYVIKSVVTKPLPNQKRVVQHVFQTPKPEKLSPQLDNIFFDNYFKKENFKIGKHLGAGKFSEVFMAEDVKTGLIVAMKKIKKQVLIKYNSSDYLQNEIKIQSAFNHPNILKLYGFYYDQEFVYLIQEYAVHGELMHELKRQPNEKFNEQQAAAYMRQIVEAFIYMHRLRVIHRDIKPENILMSYGVLKIADFGYSVYCPENRRDTFCGTIDYISPEIVSGEGYGQSVDIWSLGILVYELLLGKSPFQYESKNEILENILNVNINIPTDLSEDCQSFLKGLLVKDPAMRMSMEQVMSHPWIQKNIQQYSKESWDPSLAQKVMKIVA